MSARETVATALQTNLERHDDVLPWERADRFISAISAAGYVIVPRDEIAILRGPIDEALAECGHSSDCATNNMPAMPNGPCNCWRSKFAALHPAKEEQ